MDGSFVHSDAPKLRWLGRAGEGVVPQAGTAMRLGVLSGTFNPPTCAHLQLAEAAARQLALDEVLFVVPEIPPHKAELAAGLADRAEMLRRAVAGQRRFSAAVSTHGLLVDIHRALAPHYAPATREYFLLGRDAAERILLHWPDPDRAGALAEMFAHFEFAVAERGTRFELPAHDLATRYAGKIHSLALPPEWGLVSASRVRRLAADGESLDGVVVPEVAEYIALRGLYRR
jgi:nicotinate-nucleotide adenylyltransferase